jgi:hypothetical protein
VIRPLLPMTASWSLMFPAERPTRRASGGAHRLAQGVHSISSGDDHVRVYSRAGAIRVPVVEAIEKLMPVAKLVVHEFVPGRTGSESMSSERVSS